MSKIGVTWRMMRASSRRCTRAISSCGVSPASAADALVRAGRDREAALHQVEQPAVGIVDRDRRSARAAAELGRGGLHAVSHRAASLAW